MISLPVLSIELANKEHERISEQEEKPMRNAQLTLSHSSPARGSHDSESKSLNELNNTDSTHSSQDSLDLQSSHSPTEGQGEGSPEDHSSDTLPWNGKTAWRHDVSVKLNVYNAASAVF